ncbi:hypothetical protein D9757_011163 [Collybiopsis confluens]|uniref:DUF6536 domain-containing protein n=1 Tax=Collybiopsis confluens TaxID=2823264 RepID=A0A8H5M2I8_9AGAR|nr:hypothetical protein D9757_011163 [Collybiopsis confluens]
MAGLAGHFSYASVSTYDAHEDSPEELEMIELQGRHRRGVQSYSRLRSFRDRIKRAIARIKSKLPTGWRFGARLAIFEASAVLLTNIIILVWSVTKAGGNAIGVAFQGDCDTVDHYSVGIHIVINVLSTVLLGASNYAMQTLCAPTRDEVDRAHKRGIWLDIGLQSIRNLKYTSRIKRTLWLGLSVSSIPLHLIYNSTFFSTISAQEYAVIPATGPDLQTMTPYADGRYNWTCGYDSEGCPEGVSEAELSQWEVLNNAECITAYATDFVSDRAAVIRVVGDFSNGTLIVDMADAGRGGMEGYPYQWICSGLGVIDSQTEPLGCTSAWKNIDPSTWWWAAGNVRINYCLSQPAVTQCQLNFNVPLLVLVIVFNIVKVTCIVVAIKIRNNDPLVTIGDAIASFTSDPDIHTRDMCLASSDIQFDEWKTNRNQATLDNANIHLGIGKAHAQNFLIGAGWTVPKEGYGALLASALVANSPQLFLSLVYLLFNSLCTKVFLAREWFSYAHTRKPLRVSSPQGKQRSTYSLQMPYRFVLPLMAYSTLVHWLLSQSLFLVRISYHNEGNSSTISSCGYSPLGMLLTLVGAAALQYQRLAIPPANGSDPLKPMKWGAVVFHAEGGNAARKDSGHVCFTSGKVFDPIPGNHYL